ncbi:MAG TPA: class I SAM-dependent methyltransferase [Blastocatellia bacterium]|nr:class I SAM-dependent methyltransferase [Blastocatellia bacterium]
MKDKQYLRIVSHYEQCLERHGDTHLGVDWPKKEDAARRYRVMLEVIRPEHDGTNVRLLDFGCGASHLYEYLIERGIDHISYAGLDLSEKFISLSRRKFPQNDYYCADILDARTELPNFDYIVMNGVFTEKRELSFDEMLDYFRRMIKAVFAKADRGIAFNVMSKQVDWERPDLFHLPLDTLAGFLAGEVTRNFVIRNDYGLYEYTTYVYR